MELYLQLEKELAEWSGMPYVVSCSSGTAALHLALEALDLLPGTEVIVPDYTMIACPRAVVLAGLTPVLVDCGNDLLLDVNLLHSAVSEKADVLMAVHIYGRWCDMDVISRWAKPGSSDDLFVIEDMAECHGVKPHQDTDVACWSFFKNKIVAGEEGGAVGFRDKEYADQARSLKNMGFTEAHDYTHIPRGCNYRLANTLAEKILHSLHQVDANTFLRRQIEGMWNAAIPIGWRMPRREVPWVYDVRIRGMREETQDRMVTALRSNGIQARHGFKPICDQSEFFNCRMVAGDNIQGTKSRLASKEVIYLPIQPGVTTGEEVRRAVKIMEEVVGGSW